jgi:tetratricopeptide (TPR) repeat protein
MKYIFMMVLCVAAISCSQHILPSSTPITNAEIKNADGDTILSGHCSVSILQTQPYKKWFDESYENYIVDTQTALLTKPLLENKNVEIFLGSWCSDSKREVPRLLKVLQTVDFDTSHLQLIFVDDASNAYKQSPQHEEAGRNIHHVPAMIFYDEKKEVGRIIESPNVSLEKDMLEILQGKDYTPKYKAVAYWIKNIRHDDKNFSEKKLQRLVSKMKPLCANANEFNTYGYVLLSQKNYAEAINIFRLNTLLYPENSNVYDSLGEAYADAGDKDDAIKNYKKVLELKPGNANAIKMLAQLQ